MNEFKLCVYGKPEPAGSKRAFLPKNSQRPVVTDANPKARDWKNTVTKEALAEFGQREPFQGPLAAVFRFYMPRPKNHYGSGRNAHTLKPWAAEARPVGRPDALKLARGAEDALTGAVYRDDSQIVEERIEKHFGEPARVEIELRTLDGGKK